MSKKYDVYGIGNALVDIVTEVGDDFFEKYKIEKGFMTLVDEQRQFELIEAIHLPSSNLACGGSAANTVIAASQFGSNCFYSCKVANDDMGKFYLKDLRENGVDTNLTDGTAPEGITGKCLVMTTPDANRTMNTFLGITATYSTDQIDEDKLKDSSYLYIEGYLVTSENGQEAMKHAKKLAEKHGVKTALTFSDPSMVKYFKEPMEQVVGASVDLLFCNEEEAMLFTGKSSLLEAREELKKVAKKFAITQGANGAMIFDGDTFIDIEPYKVKAVDTNGAGDMFSGAFLYGITHGHSYAEAGKIASLASSKIVSKFGPRLEWHESKEVLNHLFD
ncbi:adenosine kinase [Fulvivirga kasyanovii]|uniref:Adenosine kinase n=1 Tax=Fulvivirga kasyanovii TaxID=396812 RepID=A0ABW9RKE8_9BACT|nr:adenosine kinase [Fulvivirga kasyanovii]MTI24564.1 adenosine kinase [Fulvivirga kasyanovii]